MNNFNEKALKAAAEVIYNNTGHAMPQARNVAKAAITAYQAALPDDDLVERVFSELQHFIEGVIVTDMFHDDKLRGLVHWILEQAAINNNKGGV
jgi:hypothetical protein